MATFDFLWLTPLKIKSQLVIYLAMYQLNIDGVDSYILENVFLYQLNGSIFSLWVFNSYNNSYENVDHA